MNETFAEARRRISVRRAREEKTPGSRFARRIFFRPRLRACSQAIAKMLRISSPLTVFLAFDTLSSEFQGFFRSNHFKRVVQFLLISIQYYLLQWYNMTSMTWSETMTSMR